MDACSIPFLVHEVIPFSRALRVQHVDGDSKSIPHGALYEISETGNIKVPQRLDGGAELKWIPLSASVTRNP
jgi:hypothetical protein